MERKTPQLAAIKQVFIDNHSPMRLEEVLNKAKSIVPGLGQATVYRWIKNLLKIGWIVAVNGPNSSILYEKAGKGHHHHFFCRRCGSMHEIQGTCIEASNVSIPSGFVVEDHELTIYGLCPSCS
tara:strand:+ start:107014 stop:107385 length:372 start_codon:yes stop_codon:yes gene_type:complete